ncbi:MAG: hypothetical protein R3E32_15875 [Chitinophagales bacterium]
MQSYFAVHKLRSSSMIHKKQSVNTTMESIDTFLQQQYPLIKKVFLQYCREQKVHLEESSKKRLFQKLLQDLRKNWSAEVEKLEMAVPQVAVLIEMTRLHCQKLLQDNNTVDLELLRIQPIELVVKYQNLIRHIVHKQAAQSNKWDKGIEEDLIANIREALVKKIASGKLATQFKENASFSTYLYRVIYHSMIDELRKLQKHTSQSLMEEVEITSQKEIARISNNEVYSELVDQHLRWLKVMIKGLPIQKQGRFEFSLKVVYRMLLKANDVRENYAHCSDALLVEILSCFGIIYSNLPESKLYQLLGEFITALENKSKPILADAIRIWVQSRITQIKKTLFSQLTSKEKASLDAYFEWLVYKLYQKN